MIKTLLKMRFKQKIKIPQNTLKIHYKLTPAAGILN